MINDNNGIILLDMDGTMCDWVKSFLPKSGVDCIHKFNKHPDRPYILEEVYKSHPNLFLELDVLEPFIILKNYIEDARIKYGFKVGILSSTGSEHHDPKVVENDKKEWLKVNGDILPEIDPELVFFVLDSPDKVMYAKDNVILVDDWKRNCDQFIDGGGSAIHLGELGQYDPHEKGIELLNLCKKMNENLVNEFRN